MGLAASQAKLLSITARLSDNELRSQSVTAAKMALANQTTEASRKYLNALDTNEFIYRTYDSAGNNIYTALTGAQLSTYAPLKNQYALVNPQGQVLVSELDAANYESSADINEFLKKYGIDSIDTGETQTVTNPDYAPAYEIWLEDYNRWKEQEPDKTNEIYWSEEFTSKDSELYKQFTEGTAGGCYTTFINPCGLGYLAPLHACDVLEHMLELGEHTTSDGFVFEIRASGQDYESHWWAEGSQQENINNVGGSPLIMAELRKALVGKYACGKEHDQNDKAHMIDCPTSWGGGGGQHELDCHTQDPCDGNELLIDKIEDLYFDYKCRYQSSGHKLNLSNAYDRDLYTRFVHLIQHDLNYALSSSVLVFDEDKYNGDMEEWKSHEPDPLEVPETLDEKIYKYSDKDKAQWYVNLWHRMNGESAEKDGKQTTSSSTTTIDQTTNTTTITTTTNTVTRRRWDILEDGLMNSQEWLKYALESGTVSLERVNFSDPTAEGSGLKNATWTSIIYSNALDISEQTNETAIAKAEAEYEQKTREIENKDKQYDSILKLLDTEHSALQAELESAQKVIKSNTDRTLKIYS